jgi:hypothetical protein
MHVPSVPAHEQLLKGAAAWDDALQREHATPSDENGSRLIASAIMCAGLNVAAAIERIGNQLAAKP